MQTICSFVCMKLWLPHILYENIADLLLLSIDGGIRYWCIYALCDHKSANEPSPRPLSKPILQNVLSFTEHSLHGPIASILVRDNALKICAKQLTCYCKAYCLLHACLDNVGVVCGITTTGYIFHLI